MKNYERASRLRFYVTIIIKYFFFFSINTDVKTSRERISLSAITQTVGILCLETPTFSENTLYTRRGSSSVNIGSKKLTEKVNARYAPLGLVPVVFQLVGLVEVLDTDFALFDTAGRHVDVFARFLSFSPDYLIYRRTKRKAKVVSHY